MDDDSIGSEGFSPLNDLEIELVRAAHEPHLRTAFMRELLDREVYLALLLADGARVETGADGRAIIPEGVRLELGAARRRDRDAIPFFSAPSRAQTYVRQDHVIAPERVRALLARHPGAAFVLNPGSDYALDLDAEDAAALLRGDFTAH
jgi:hypothetical protein